MIDDDIANGNWGNGYESAYEEILELIDKEIKYFEKPETVLNKAMIHYLKDLKQKIKER